MWILILSFVVGMIIGWRMYDYGWRCGRMFYRLTPSEIKEEKDLTQRVGDDII